MQYTTYLEDIPNDVLVHLQSCSIIAVDTELTGLSMFRDEVCTVQISDNLGVNLIVKIDNNWIPDNVKSILENESVRKVFHHAPVDVCMLNTSLGIDTRNFHCLKVMSKVVRTYTNQHSLKDLAQEILGNKVDKSYQQSCWFVEELSPSQEKYAIRDVVDLLDIYKGLDKMIESRGMLRSGLTCREVHEEAQLAVKHMIPLLISGYGSYDNNWDLGWLFKH